MPFEKEPSRAPASIGNIRVVLDDLVSPATQQINGVISVLAADGTEVNSRRLDLAPHLTTQQRNGLLSLLASLRTKATAEIL